MPVVATGELAVFLQHAVKADAEALAIRVAEGWLRSVTSFTAWPPSPVPEDLWAWCLELAALAYGNPTSLVTRSTDEETRNWALDRRREILDAARDQYGGSGAGAAAAPLGADSFPIVLDWPDPIVITEGVTE